MKVRVNVVLIGLDGDGAFSYRMRKEDFKKLLDKSLPLKKIYVANQERELNVDYVMEYNVLHLQHVEEVERRIAASLVKRDSPSLFASPPSSHSSGKAKTEKRKYVVHCGEEEGVEKLTPRKKATKGGIDSFFEEMEKTLHTKKEKGREEEGGEEGELLQYTVFLLNPSKQRIFHLKFKTKLRREEEAEEAFSYAYSYEGGVENSVWVGKGRYVVVDLSAGVSLFGPTSKKEANVAFNSLPSLHLSLSRLSLLPLLSSHFQRTGKLVEWESGVSQVVVSTVKHLFLPDLHHPSLDANVVQVPILIFTNHKAFHPSQFKSSLSQFDLDVDLISRQIKLLTFPSQIIQLHFSVHDIHDHKKVAMAFSNSVRTTAVHVLNLIGRYRVQHKHFVDGHQLLEELENAGLFSSLDTFFTEKRVKSAVSLQKSPQSSNNNLDNSPFSSPPSSSSSPSSTGPSNTGKAVYPVFIFSFVGKEKDFSMQNFEFSTITSQAAVILQVTLSFSFAHKYISKVVHK